MRRQVVAPICCFALYTFSLGVPFSLNAQETLHREEENPKAAFEALEPDERKTHQTIALLEKGGSFFLLLRSSFGLSQSIRFPDAALHYVKEYKKAQEEVAYLERARLLAPGNETLPARLQAAQRKLSVYERVVIRSIREKIIKENKLYELRAFQALDQEIANQSFSKESLRALKTIGRRAFVKHSLFGLVGIALGYDADCRIIASSLGKDPGVVAIAAFAFEEQESDAKTADSE